MSKAEKTRQYIIEKTAPIFNAKGYAGTSINDMTEATGLTKGSIYGNFSNKDEVALAVFDFNLKKVNSILQQEMEKETSAKQQLLVYVKVYQNFLQYPFPEGGCPVLNTAVEADDTHPELKQRAGNAVLSWKKMVSDRIKKGIAQGEFKKEIDADATALCMIAMIEGATMIARVTGKAQFRTTIMQSVKKMIEGLG
jgi:TetR/AcrR family transcriptional regulator, transcriptional repressor for nem operon